MEIVIDKATEIECMKEVLNMNSAVRIPAVHNLGKSHSLFGTYIVMIDCRNKRGSYVCTLDKFYCLSMYIICMHEIEYGSIAAANINLYNKLLCT